MINQNKTLILQAHSNSGLMSVSCILEIPAALTRDNPLMPKAKVVAEQVHFLLAFNASLLEGGNKMVAIVAACFLHGALCRRERTSTPLF